MNVGRSLFLHGYGFLASLETKLVVGRHRTTVTGNRAWTAVAPSVQRECFRFKIGQLPDPVETASESSERKAVNDLPPLFDISSL